AFEWLRLCVRLRSLDIRRPLLPVAVYHGQGGVFHPILTRYSFPLNAGQFGHDFWVEITHSCSPNWKSNSSVMVGQRGRSLISRRNMSWSCSRFSSAKRRRQFEPASAARPSVRSSYINASTVVDAAPQCSRRRRMSASYIACISISLGTRSLMADTPRGLRSCQSELDRRRMGRYGRTTQRRYGGRSTTSRLSWPSATRTASSCQNQIPGLTSVHPWLGRACQNHHKQFQRVGGGSIPVAPTIKFQRLKRKRAK